MSMLTGFFRYNQVLVVEGDRHKKDFMTPLGTFTYIKISFGLLNVSATFERAMDHAFNDIIGKIVSNYQDNLTVYSKLKI